MAHINYKEIKDADGYFITTNGRVYSKRKGKIKEIAIFENSRGYKRVNVKKGGIYKQVFVHRLVAENFIRGIKGGEEVNHIDGDKNNNNVENLEIILRSDNMNHSCYQLKNLVKPVMQIDIKSLEVIKYYPSMVKAGEETGVGEQSIGKVCMGKRRTAGGFYWCYSEDYKKMTKEHMRSRIKPESKNTAIVQIDIETGEKLNRYSSIKEAKLKTGVSTISNVLNGNFKTGGGYHWEYEKDFL